MLQPNTIYEQLGYRFENESFTTVQDLITCYVGNREPISARSGAIITIPKTRVVPVSRKNRLLNLSEPTEHDYVSLAQEAARHVVPVEAILIEKSFAPEGLTQISLNLKPPPGLLEELEEIPDAIRDLAVYRESVDLQTESQMVGESDIDLSTFSSIIFPMKAEDVKMSPEVIEETNLRIAEVSDRAMAFHITLVDWKVFKREPLRDDSPGSGSPVETPTATAFVSSSIFENILNEKRYRWNCVLERAVSFSHFIVVTVLGAQDPEAMIHKWICIANELKTGMGNFFGFCNIMRGLTSVKISSSESRVDWLKLRRDHTNAAFQFETSMRNAYFSLLQGNEAKSSCFFKNEYCQILAYAQLLVAGTEAYPPNTIIPDVFPCAIILEGEIEELFPLLQRASIEEKLRLTVAHLRLFYAFCDNEQMYSRNWERLMEDSNIEQDIILTDICRTETHLYLLWGPEYRNQSLVDRCRYFEN